MKQLKLILILIVAMFILAGCGKEVGKNATIVTDEADLEIVDRVITTYLENTDHELLSGTGQIYSAYYLYGVEVDNNDIYIYIWALIEEFDNGELKSGVSLPLRLTITQDLDGQDIMVKVSEHAAPDTASYQTDIKKIFPKRYHELIENSSEYMPILDDIIRSKVSKEGDS